MKLRMFVTAQPSCHPSASLRTSFRAEREISMHDEARFLLAKNARRNDSGCCIARLRESCRRVLFHPIGQNRSLCGT
jgi:hypothetical protein